RDVEPTLLTARELLHRAVREGCQIEGFDELVGTRPGRDPGHPVEGALVDELVPNALGEAAARELPDVANARPHGGWLTVDVVTHHAGPPGTRRDERREHAQARRLAGPVGAEKGDQLAAG